MTMKSLTEELWFEVPNRRGFVNITGVVEELVAKSGVQEGLCLVNAMHITASVFINDAEAVFRSYRHSTQSEFSFFHVPFYWALGAFWAVLSHCHPA